MAAITEAEDGAKVENEVRRVELRYRAQDLRRQIASGCARSLTRSRRSFARSSNLSTEGSRFAGLSS
ncbi:hypothetical protein [Thiomonas sp.]